MKMQFVEANGARIPQIGLGTWELRGDVCVKMVAEALQRGYRHIDTAEMYGNEEAVGEGIRQSGIARGEIFVTTKVWHTHLERAALLQAAKESLSKLKLDYVDLYLIHWPNPSVPLEETIGALNEAKEQGLAKHIGVANFTAALVREAAKLSKAKLVNNQVEMHVYLDQSRVVGACKREGLSVTAYSPIVKGAAAKDKTLQNIGAAHRKSAAQVSLRYLVQQGIIIIPRTSKPERLSENAAIFDFELSDAEMKAIRALADPNGRRINPSWAPEWD
jgi:diketogulonate reductase-like aldo/keto reductase